MQSAKSNTENSSSATPDDEAVGARVRRWRNRIVVPTKQAKQIKVAKKIKLQTF